MGDGILPNISALQAREDFIYNVFERTEPKRRPCPVKQNNACDNFY